MAEAEVDQDFTELQDVEEKIRALTDELEEKMVELDKDYSKKKRPLFDERIKICSKIPNFWLNALLNHRDLQEFINTADYDCLRNLKILDVQDVDTDGMQGTRYQFTFSKNSFFDNQVIFKEFKYHKDSGELVVESSPIQWKDGCNLTTKGQQKAAKGKGKRAQQEEEEGENPPSFFCWFDAKEESESPIGDWIREDIWKDPFKYFCGEGDEDEGEGEEDEGEDGEDGEEGGDGEEDGADGDD